MATEVLNQAKVVCDGQMFSYPNGGSLCSAAEEEGDDPSAYTCIIFEFYK